MKFQCRVEIILYCTSSVCFYHSEVVLSIKASVDLSCRRQNDISLPHSTRLHDRVQLLLQLHRVIEQSSIMQIVILMQQATMRAYGPHLSNCCLKIWNKITFMFEKFPTKITLKTQKRFVLLKTVYGFYFETDVVVLQW